MTRAEWKSSFNALPPGLSLGQMARRLRKPYRLVADWAKRLGVVSVHDRNAAWPMKRRRVMWRVKWDKVPWDAMNDNQLARHYQVSRQIVGRRRAQFEGGFRKFQ